MVHKYTCPKSVIMYQLIVISFHKPPADFGHLLSVVFYVIMKVMEIC